MAVECRDGKKFSASEEIIVCAGSINIPKILLHSGIGDRKTLRDLGIESWIDNPEVGKNFNDHFDYRQLYRVEASGPRPKGSYIVAFERIDPDAIKAALHEDGVSDPSQHPILVNGRPHVETFIQAVPGIDFRTVRNPLLYGKTVFLRKLLVSY